MRATKKPITVDVLRWNGDTAELDQFLREGDTVVRPADGTLLIVTLEGMMTAQFGDWIIRGVRGELYTCKPDIFEATYDIESIPKTSA